MRNRGGEFGMNLPRTEPGDIPFEVGITDRLILRCSGFSTISHFLERISYQRKNGLDFVVPLLCSNNVSQSVITI